jgi:hypothetical protein
MTKGLLLASVAALTVSATPTLAQTLDDATVTYSNDISVTLDNSSTFESDITVEGDIQAEGDFDLDAAASAITDSKQIIEGNVVILDELDGDEASVSNTVEGIAVDVDGNTGVNAAAGHFNAQSNIATIAASTGDDDIGGNDNDDEDGDEDGAMVRANSTSLQTLSGTVYSPGDADGDDADTASDTNTASIDSVASDGNAGVNAAAGAFNMQTNLLSLAVATDASLADASAGVIQNIAGNAVLLADSVNTASIGTVSGAGNIGVNVAAGVGNMQHNSLTVAASGTLGD